MAMMPIAINSLETIYPYPNGSVAHAYDLQGRLLSISRSSSTIDEYGNTDSTTEQLFDATDTLVRTNIKETDFKAPDLTRWIIGLPSQSTTTIIDAATNKTYINTATATFYPDGKPKSETIEPSNANSVTRRYTYDVFGNRESTSIEAADIETRSSRTQFTADGRFPMYVENALGDRITTEFDVNLSKPLIVTDANGLSKEFLYDGFGTTLRESRQHQSNGATRGRQIVLPKWCDENPEAGCPDNAIYFIAAIDDEGEAPEIAFYDTNGKELRRQTYGHKGQIIAVDTQYDQNAKVACVTQPYFIEQNNPAAQLACEDSNNTNDVRRWTKYEYDILGREISRTNAAGDLFTTSYDGFSISATNPGNDDGGHQTSTIENNIFGQPIKSIDPMGGITQYEYDGRGQLVKTIDDADNIATITYDPIFGRKIAMDDPDLGAWTYEYDSLGNLVKQTDAKQQITILEYDILNRLVSRTDDHTGPKEETTTWTYTVKPSSGDLPAGQILGGLQKVESDNFTRTVKYDSFSRVNEAITTMDGQSFIQRTGYQGTADKVDWIQYPSGLSVRTTYDDYGFPETVEGLALNNDTYTGFQAASAELNQRQRDFEQWKLDNLTLQQLADLEEHEAQVRVLGSELSDFYDDFADNPERQAAQDEAKRYQNLIEQVQIKLGQHNNWLSHYQSELDTRYDRIRPQLDRLDELSNLISDEQGYYHAIYPSYQVALDNANHFAEAIGGAVDVIEAAQYHYNLSLESLHHHIRFGFKANVEEIFVSHLDVFIDHLENHLDYTIEHYVDTDRSAGALEVTFNSINLALQNLANFSETIENANNVIETNNWVALFNEWDGIRSAKEAPLAQINARIQTYDNEAQPLNAQVLPDLNRVNDWLSPIVTSHNNIILSYNDRVRAYVTKIALQTGSYAPREDLSIDRFLKPFQNHLNYIDCLRTNATTGACYAQNLVHVYDEDGNIDEPEQQVQRNEIEGDAVINIRQFYDIQRFFCPYYVGYNCAEEFALEFKRIAETVHSLQCNKMSAGQKERIKESDSDFNCDADQVVTIPDILNPGATIEVTLMDFGPDISIHNTQSFMQAVETKHRNKVEQLVTVATAGTYNAETNFDDIIAGNIWQSNPDQDNGQQKPESRERECTAWLPAAADGQNPVCTAYKYVVDNTDSESASDSNANDFVLIYRGEVQNLVTQTQTEQQRTADSGLKYHQQQIELILNASNAQGYAHYLAVLEQSAIVDRLYNELDQAYASAEYVEDYDQQKKVYWEAKEINAAGQILKAKYGNGVSSTYTYDQFGRINSVFAADADAQSFVNQSYTFDALGNLTNRNDVIEGFSEDFTYDNLNRLVGVQYQGAGAAHVKKLSADTVSYSYDSLGNLIRKSDILGGGSNGNYTYGESNAGPHAVSNISGLGAFSYDANGNQISGNGRTTEYSPFNKPTSIIKGGRQTAMWYGPERQLVKQTEETDQGLETTLYIGGLFEQVEKRGGGTVHRHNISVAGSSIAVVETAVPTSQQVDSDGLPILNNTPQVISEHYLHKNHQGSVIALTDVQGEVIERRYYDAFGDLKNYIGQAGAFLASPLAYNAITSIGFTGHKLLQTAAVIHMRGRVYDPMIGRFLSADPHIQSPLNSQSLNRYAYVWNNPLSFTDPSGYFLSSIFKALKKVFKAITKIIKAVVKVIKKVIKVIIKSVAAGLRYLYEKAPIIATIAIAIIAPYAAAAILGTTTAALGLGGSILAGAIGGGITGFLATGSLSGLIKGAFLGGLSAGIAYGIGSAIPSAKNATFSEWKPGGNIFSKVDISLTSPTGFVRTLSTFGKVAKSVLHGIGQGFVSKLRGGSFSKGFLSSFVSNSGQEFGLASTPLEAGLVGGAAAELSGGDFSKGFATSFAISAYNHEKHKRQKIRRATSSFAQDSRNDKFFKWLEATFKFESVPLQSVGTPLLDVGAKGILTLNLTADAITGTSLVFNLLDQPLIGANVDHNGIFSLITNPNKDTDLFSGLGKPIVPGPQSDVQLFFTLRRTTFLINTSSLARGLFGNFQTFEK